MDYEFLKKGSERADGSNDVEEFGITEVSKKFKPWYLDSCHDQTNLEWLNSAVHTCLKRESLKVGQSYRDACFLCLKGDERSIIGINRSQNFIQCKEN